MARPKKQTVDYFPHQCNHGKTMFILEQKYGNDGYAFWFKLLELLGCAEGHYLKLENPVDWEFLTAKTRLSGETCEEILNLLAKLEAIDAEAWEKRIVWSDNFIDNVKEAYRNRTVEIPKKPDCLRKKPHKGKDNQRQKSANEMKVNETKLDEKNHGDTLFELFWNTYPRRKEKQAAFTKWKACVKDDQPADIITAARNYAAECRDKEEKFIKLAKTFLGPDKHYREYIVMPEPVEKLLAPYHRKGGAPNDPPQP